MTASTINESDRQLLERFASQGDEGAFTKLVQRHGPMVLGVCRQILRHEDDAEDAFQATFLVLARKARSIRAAEALPNWLYGVARRLALRSKSAVARRHAREVALVEPPTQAAPETEFEELAPALHEEIGRLAEKYRLPFVLCYLEGKTNEEAARQLGCPSGTVFSRLARARERLRGRLTRRGLALSTGVLVATLATLSQQVRAAAPQRLLTTTVRRALRFGGSKTGAAADLPLPVRELAEWGVKSLPWPGWQWAVGLGVLLGLSALIGGLLLVFNGESANRIKERPPVEAAAPVDQAAVNKANQIKARLQGPWKMTAMVIEGKPAPPLFLVAKLTIKGDQMTLANTTGTFKLATQKNPMEMDWICPNGTSFGIFEFRGESLVICLLQQRRPADFAPGPGTAIMTFERSKN